MVVDEKQLTDFIDTYMKRQYGWLFHPVFEGDVTNIVRSVQPYQVNLRRAGESGPDGATYMVAATGYKPAVGDHVTVLRQSEQVGHVLAPLTGTGSISVPGLTKLAPDIVLTVAASGVDFTNIPQNFRNLMALVSAKTDQGASQAAWLQVNGDGGAHYDQAGLANNAGTFAGNFYNVNQVSARYGSAATESATHVITFPNYSGTVTGKQWVSLESRHDAGVSSILEYWTGAWTFSPTAGINHLGFGVGAGSYGIGSTFSIYGF